MVTARTDFGIWKRIRLPVIALGCSVAIAAGAADAPPFSDTPAPCGCGTAGVALQVLGSGGPELQDKRASTSYLVWRGGVPRVLVDSGGGSALRFGESGATMTDLDVILLTHLYVDHTAVSASRSAATPTATSSGSLETQIYSSRTTPCPRVPPESNVHSACRHPSSAKSLQPPQ